MTDDRSWWASHFFCHSLCHCCGSHSSWLCDSNWLCQRWGWLSSQESTFVQVGWYLCGFPTSLSCTRTTKPSVNIVVMYSGWGLLETVDESNVTWKIGNLSDSPSRPRPGQLHFPRSLTISLCEMERQATIFVSRRVVSWSLDTCWAFLSVRGFVFFCSSLLPLKLGMKVTMWMNFESSPSYHVIVTFVVRIKC